ncbi:hypothetical protein Btru_008686 [Bulinus truncatus]|nr:hypothetical protein Btru_008686 [Bulinus truncatus]
MWPGLDEMVEGSSWTLGAAHVSVTSQYVVGLNVSVCHTTGYQIFHGLLGRCGRYMTGECADEAETCQKTTTFDGEVV